MLLTYLCTYKDYLPQGAPTSSYISNLIMKDFDEEIGNFCNEINVSYTRYSDDMTFSGEIDASTIIKKVRKELYKLELELNDEKIHLISRNKEQNVTGVVVNEKAQVSIKYRKKIRQEVYFIKKHGLSNHLSDIKYVGNEKMYLSSLYGRVLYVLRINRDKEFIEYKKYLKDLIKQIGN